MIRGKFPRLVGPLRLRLRSFHGGDFRHQPSSVAFWDPYSTYYWQTKYVPGERAVLFQQVLASIPPTAKVASTDFVHPRFTHFARSKTTAITCGQSTTTSRGCRTIPITS